MMDQRFGLVPSANSDQRRLKSESYAGGKLVQEGDLVLNRLKAHLGVFARARQAGVISPDYTVLRPTARSDVRFYEYVLKSALCRPELRTRAKGIVEGFWRLYTDDFYDIRLPNPPPEEQRLIVRFLDWHGALTARLISAKRKLIVALNEQKMAALDRHITGRNILDANWAPTSNNISEMPSHWIVKRLKNVCRFNYGSALMDRGDDSGDIPVLGSNGPVGVHSVSNVRGPCIIIGRKGSFGKVNWSSHDVFAIDTTYFVDQASANEDMRWTFHILTWARLDDLSRDTAIPGLSRDEAYQRLIPVPPSREEQRAIAASIDADTAQLLEAERQVHREITLVQEFHTRLVADLVTGQLDVRAAAAALPEAVEAADVADEAEEDDGSLDLDEAEDEELAA